MSASRASGSACCWSMPGTRMDTLTWNGVSWFVSVEFALCLLFPVLLWLAEGGVWRGFALIAAGPGGPVGAAVHVKARPGHHLSTMACCAGLSDFAIGVGLAVLFRQRQAARPAAGHGCIRCCRFCCCALLAYVVMNTGWSHTRMDIFTVLPLMALVFVLAFDRGLVARACCKTRLPQLLGEWSYAIYLGQTAWLLAIRFFEQRLYPPPDDNRAGHALFQPDLVAGAAGVGHRLRAVGRPAGGICRTPRRSQAAAPASAAALTRKASRRHPKQQTSSEALWPSPSRKVVIVTGRSVGESRSDN